MLNPHDLSSSTLFSSLSEKELSDVAALMGKEEYRKEELIFEQGEYGDRFYYVVSGEVRIWLQLPDGGSKELATLGAGQCFGELALLDDLPRSADVEVKQDCELWSLRREEFLSLLRGNASLAVKLLQVIGRRLRQADRHIQDLSAL